MEILDKLGLKANYPKLAALRAKRIEWLMGVKGHEIVVQMIRDLNNKAPISRAAAIFAIMSGTQGLTASGKPFPAGIADAMASMAGVDDWPDDKLAMMEALANINDPKDIFH